MNQVNSKKKSKVPIESALEISKTFKTSFHKVSAETSTGYEELLQDIAERLVSETMLSEIILKEENKSMQN